MNREWRVIAVSLLVSLGGCMEEVAPQASEEPAAEESGAEDVRSSLTANLDQLIEACKGENLEKAGSLLAWRGALPDASENQYKPRIEVRCRQLGAVFADGGAYDVTEVKAEQDGRDTLQLLHAKVGEDDKIIAYVEAEGTWTLIDIDSEAEQRQADLECVRQRQEATT